MTSSSSSLKPSFEGWKLPRREVYILYSYALKPSFEGWKRLDAEQFTGPLCSFETFL